MLDFRNGSPRENGIDSARNAVPLKFSQKAHCFVVGTRRPQLVMSFFRPVDAYNENMRFETNNSISNSIFKVSIGIDTKIEVEFLDKDTNLEKIFRVCWLISA